MHKMQTTVTDVSRVWCLSVSLPVSLSVSLSISLFVTVAQLARLTLRGLIGVAFAKLLWPLVCALLSNMLSAVHVLLVVDKSKCLIN